MENKTVSDTRVTEYLYFRDIIFTLMIPLSAFGTAFNIMNIVAIVLAKFHKRTTFKLVLSLAVSDLLIDLGGAFMAASNFVSKNSSNQWQILTMFSQTLFSVGGMTCVGSLILISVDLLLKTAVPLKYTFLERCCIIFFVITWIFSLALGLVWRTVISAVYKHETQSFVVAYIYAGVNLIWVHLGFKLIGSFLLLILNMIIYVKIRNLSARSQHQRINTRKSAITLFLVVATFFFFDVPHYLITSIHLIDPSILSDYITMLYMSVSSLPFLILNTITDPIIYAFCISAIRAIYTNLLKKFHWW